MAVCSFAGHKEVYDADMASKMQTEVDRLVKENDAVEFLVYPVYPSGMLSYFFLLAALKARTQYPQKVTITCVIYHGPEAEMSGEDLTYSYMSDKVITIDLENTKKRDPTIGYKRMLKWIPQNSTHLITYFYDTIYDPGNHLGKIPETLEIISLTTHETETAILEAAQRMTEKEQTAFFKLHEGRTMSAVGEATGVGRERVRQLLSHGSRAIHLELTRRYNRALAAKRTGPRTCGIFALGEASRESLTRFKHIMECLASSYNATDIFIEQSYVSSGFLFVLENLHISLMLCQWSNTAIHITVLMDNDSLSGDCDDMAVMEAALCPPCHAVGYVNRVDSRDDFNVIADMIERMDFCVCNLSATPYGEKIKQYAAQTGRTVLLDINTMGNSTAGKRKKPLLS